MNQETGCLFDSHHGIHIPEMICELAQSHGWKGEWDEEHTFEASDEAIEWLNDNVADKGYSYDWWEGGFYYWSEDDWHEAYDLSYVRENDEDI